MTARLDVGEIAKEWMRDLAFKAEYDVLEEEFSLATALIRALSAAHDKNFAEVCGGDRIEAKDKF